MISPSICQKVLSCWRACLPALYESYQGICAYLAIHFERITGVGSVDHFAAKSARPDQAYEWSNYRLACSRMNSRKNDYEDVLDPFVIENGLFRLELVSGHIRQKQKIASMSTDYLDQVLTAGLRAMSAQ